MEYLLFADGTITTHMPDTLYEDIQGLLALPDATAYYWPVTVSYSDGKRWARLYKDQLDYTRLHECDVPKTILLMHALVT